MKIQKLFDLSGRVAVVTGGGVGLGKQMAEGLAEAGADIVICSRRLDVCKEATREIHEKLRVRTLPFEVDITNPATIDSMVHNVLDTFGKIDILVNNSGVAWAGPPESLTPEGWQKVIDTNLTGTFNSCQAIGKVMISQKRGKIINISSIIGMLGSQPELLDTISYSVSKGALISLTRDLAVKWARYNIYVNALAPSFFPTHMTKWVIEHRSEKMVSRTPLGRLGHDNDVKGPVVFLASDASNFITGHVLPVDGGWTINL